MSNLMDPDVAEDMSAAVTSEVEQSDPLGSDSDSAVDSEVGSVQDEDPSEMLFVLAQRYRKAGNRQRAKELLWALVEEHPGTPEAIKAKAELSGMFDVCASDAVGQALLERLLGMAQRYKSEGNLREATELFWTLAQEHPQTTQAATAKLGLLALADGYERAGKQHMARDMYERLLDLED